MLMPTYNPSGGGGGGSDFPVYLNTTVLLGSLNRSGTVITGAAVTATHTGTTGAVSYEWEFVSGDSVIYPVNPGLPTTRFVAEIDLVPMSYSATYRLKVTDSIGKIGYSDGVVSVLSTYLGPGELF